MAWVTITNVKGPKGDKGDKGEGVADSLRYRPTSELPSLNVNDWIGTSLVGMYRFPLPSTAQEVINRPLGSDGSAFVQIEPLATGGSLVTWTEYLAPRRTFEKIVSSTAANRTDWKRTDQAYRTALHQLSMPGNNNLNDPAPSRHVRVPVKFFVDVDSWELVLKNYNDRTGKNYGRLSFVDVYIGERAQDEDGNYTANYAEGTRVNLGSPALMGAGGEAERYSISDIHFRLEANKEYVIGYAYTHTNDASHMGIGGSYLGTLVGGASSYDVTNVWSPNTPLDVYIKPEISDKTPFYAYPGSSSETGTGSEYPLRDVWTWRHAEAHKAVPALIGQSGSLLSTWVASNNYIRNKFSTIARADKVIGNPGSNDIYSGESLETVQDRFTAFADWVRLHLSDTFEATDVFPRASESVEVSTVRRSFNEWLYALPENILQCHVRANATANEDDLLDPKYNSGDNTHLNTAGQHMVAAAILSGRPKPDQSASIVFQIDTDGVPYF